MSKKQVFSLALPLLILLCSCAATPGQAAPSEQTDIVSVSEPAPQEAPAAAEASLQTAGNLNASADYEPAPFSSAAFETSSARDDWYDNGVFSAYCNQAFSQTADWEYSVTVTGNLDPNPYGYDGYDVYRVHLPNSPDLFFAVPYSQYVTAANVYAYDAASNQMKLVFTDGVLLSQPQDSSPAAQQILPDPSALPYVDRSIPVLETSHSTMIKAGKISSEIEIAADTLTAFRDLDDCAIYFSDVGHTYYGVVEDRNVAFLMAGIQMRVGTYLSEDFLNTPPLILTKEGTDHLFLCWQLRNGIFVLETYGLSEEWSDDIFMSLIYADSTDRLTLFARSG